MWLIRKSNSNIWGWEKKLKPRILLMQTCITKYMGLRSTYMYLAYKLDVHYCRLCVSILHTIVVELFIFVACLPQKSLPGGKKYLKRHNNFAPTLLPSFFSEKHDAQLRIMKLVRIRPKLYCPIRGTRQSDAPPCLDWSGGIEPMFRIPYALHL